MHRCLKGQVSRVRLVACLIAVAAACGHASQKPTVQALLDSYAPGLPLGDRVSPEAHQRYHLRAAPYLGYRDSTFTHPSGLLGLMIRVDEYVDDRSPTVSARARIEHVAFRIRGASGIAALRARVDSALGGALILCTRSAVTGPMVTHIWRGSNGQGIRMVARRGGHLPSDTIFVGSTIAPGTAVVTFGARVPDPIGGQTEEPCVPSDSL